MPNSKIKSILIAGCLLVLLTACGSNPKWLEPTGRAASIPGDKVGFSKYVQDSHRNIKKILDELRFTSGQKPYLGDYTSEQAAEMRGPFQEPEKDSDMCWDTLTGGGKGFLLIHGLTDSPYLMSSLRDSLHKAYPCALIRAVLLPGHGTVAGDSLNMKHEDWLSTINYGVRSFQSMDKIKNLYLVGFSTGTALVIKYMKESENKEKIKGLILLSAAVKAKSKFAFLSPFVRKVVNWTDKNGEYDAARYESFSVNAGAEFYELTKSITDSEYKLDVPVLMAVSADDATIDPFAARKFFCERMVSDRALIWYESSYTEDESEPVSSSCIADITTRQIKGIEQNYNGITYRFANLSHIAITMSPGDKHYGVKGNYRDCKYYESKQDGAFEACQEGSKRSIFGEENIACLSDADKPDYDYLRRGTFNPDYEKLEAAILCFTKEECDLKSILTFGN